MPSDPESIADLPSLLLLCVTATLLSCRQTLHPRVWTLVCLAPLSDYSGDSFALRFRVFDITAADKSANASAPVLVEARSQAFKVYSPRK